MPAHFKSIKWFLAHCFFVIPIILYTLYILPVFSSPVYTSHPPIDPSATGPPLGQYCENTTNSRHADCLYMPGDPPCHTLLNHCAANEDCKEYQNPDGSGQQLTRCVPRDTGAPPGSTSNFGPPPAGLVQIEAVFGRVISLFVGFAFVALFVVLVWAGIKFLTSGGDPKALEAARNTVTWALLGILFLAIAWLVLQLIAAFTGIEGLKTFDVGKLCIPGTDLGTCVPKSVPAPTP